VFRASEITRPQLLVSAVHEQPAGEHVPGSAHRRLEGPFRRRKHRQPVEPLGRRKVPLTRTAEECAQAQLVLGTVLRKAHRDLPGVLILAQDRDAEQWRVAAIFPGHDVILHGN